MIPKPTFWQSIAMVVITIFLVLLLLYLGDVHIVLPDVKPSAPQIYECDQDDWNGTLENATSHIFMTTEMRYVFDGEDWTYQPRVTYYQIYDCPLCGAEIYRFRISPMVGEG